MTVRDDIVPMLAGTPLFAGYSRGEIGTLIGQFDEQTFMADRRIVTEGLDGMDFFILLDGAAEVIRDDRVVAQLGPGDFFGEVAALDDGPRTASVRSTTQVRCLGLPNRTFREFLLRNPRFTVNVIHAVVRRFRGVVTSSPQVVS